MIESLSTICFSQGQNAVSLESYLPHHSNQMLLYLSVLAKQAFNTAETHLHKLTNSSLRSTLIVNVFG